MKHILALAAIALVPLLSGPVLAAAGTDCLCRSADGKTFYTNTVRHHRWACDFHFGYLRGDPPNQKAKRPITETCNGEEIIQWKVYRCMSAGCTYPSSHSTEEPNAELRTIEKAPERRNP